MRSTTLTPGFLAQRARSLLLAAATLSLASCSLFSPQKSSSAVSPAAYDTTFSIADAVFRNDTGIARSVVSKGNNNRLWKFFEKARAGGTVRIGFVGGSVTGGAGASDLQHDYASIFCRNASAIFPNTTFEQINAGVGGTNSTFGASRVRDDLLSHDPDLIVVEFAVNDDPADTFTTMASMEGLVRQCLQNPEVPVLMLFYMNRTGDTVDQHLQATIGEHYGLPLLSYRSVCWPLVASGAIPLDSLFADSIHPNNRGHQLLAFLLLCFLSNTLGENSVAPAVPVATTLVSDVYERATIMKGGDSLVRIAADTGWTETLGDFNRCAFQSLRSGDTLLISAQVRQLTIGYQLSTVTTSGMQIVVDSAAPDTLWSSFPGSWMQLHRLYLDDPAITHKIRFTSLDSDTFAIDYVLYTP
jgi:lysophospholipase L1-like esterase